MDLYDIKEPTIVKHPYPIGIKKNVDPNHINTQMALKKRQYQSNSTPDHALSVSMVALSAS